MLLVVGGVRRFPSGVRAVGRAHVMGACACVRESAPSDSHVPLLSAHILRTGLLCSEPAAPLSHVHAQVHRTGLKPVSP
jgi:hypothetical protein